MDLNQYRLESILSVSWDVRLWEDVESWVLGLDDETYHLVAAAITRLESEGPTLGRPTADRIRDSRHHNMKKLRPGSAGRSEIRILFAFDPKRRAILLVVVLENDAFLVAVVLDIRFPQLGPTE